MLRKARCRWGGMGSTAGWRGPALGCGAGLAGTAPPLREQDGHRPARCAPWAGPGAPGWSGRSQRRPSPGRGSKWLSSRQASAVAPELAQGAHFLRSERVAPCIPGLHRSWAVAYGVNLEKTNLGDRRKLRAHWRTAQLWLPFLEMQPNLSSQGGVVASWGWEGFLSPPL